MTTHRLWYNTHMQTNLEIRNEAWRLLWERKWFWKLLGAAILLQVCSQAVVTIVNGIVYRLGVFNLTAMMNLQEEHMPLPQFTPRLIWEFSSSTALSLFFAFILGGIALYGNSRLQLRAVEDNDESWMKTAFSGFKIPLELAWLTFRVSLVYIFWMVLALIPAAALVALLLLRRFSAVPTPQTPVELSLSVAVVTLASVIFIAIYCIPFYKYRYLFRIKADHPDWSAGECMRHCREIVYGSKWRIFIHDCSYWRILLGALLPLLVIMAVVLLATAILGGRSAGAPTPSAAVAVGAAFGVVAMLAAYLALLVFGAISVHYIGVGQSILYREISRTKTNQQ